MKHFILSFLLIAFFAGNAISQIVLNYPGSTATQMVDRLVGQGVTFSNAIFLGAGSYNGSTEGNKAIFTGGGPIIGIQSGIIFSTGNAMWAYGPNTLSAMSVVTGTPSDPTLAAVSTGTVYDAVGVQFDFVPESNVIQFKYVFGSEEYNEYVNGGFNDIFGFFVTSLSSDGYNYVDKNIAIVPGTTGTTVAIDNINNGAAAAGSTASGPCEYCAYYRDNAAGSYNVEYDGFTAVLTATCNVQPCASYRMKIVIGDVGDQVYDSAVFLEEGSFTSPVIDNVQVSYSNPSAGSNSNAVEGCSNASFALSLSGTTPMSRNVPITFAGSATFGTDYTTSPNIASTWNTLYPNQYYITIPAGSSNTTLTIIPVADAIGEGTETVQLTIQTNLCGAPVYNSASVNILDNSTAFSGTVSPSTSTICVGNNVGLSFTPTGGQSPFTYAWSSGQNTSSITANPPSSQPYTITVTDACGSVATASAQIDVYPVPAGSAVPSSLTMCSGETTNFTLTTGYPNSSFTWTATASGNVTGHSNASSTSIAQTLVNNGTTDATVTYAVTPSANGCSGNPYNVTVTVKPHPIAYNVTGGGAFCPSSDGISVGLDGSETGVTYNIYVDGVLITTLTGDGNAINSGPISNLGNVTITALNTTTGCTYAMIGSTTLSHAPRPTFDDITIANVVSCVSPDGSITVTAGGTTGPYNYSLNGSAYSTNNIFTGLNTGFYTVIIQDANGCIADSTGIQITSSSGPTINSIDLIHNICPGDSAGEIKINATPGVEYSIDNGATYGSNNIFQNLPSGVYYVLVRDAGSCIASQQVTITSPQAFQVTENITDMVCGTLGSASISVQGGTNPYTYAWSNDPLNTTFAANNLDQGSYFVTITDASNCTHVTELVVAAVGGQGTASVTSIDHVSCNSYADGTVTVQMDNGIGPYTYSWSHNNILNSPTADNLNGGLYLVTISDAYNCTAVLSLNINEPSAITSSITTQGITCFGSNNGSLSVSPQGGTLPYTYIWSSGQSTSNISGLSEDSYTVTITDLHGCTFTTSSNITEPEEIIVTPVITQPTCSGESSGAIIITVTGGNPNYIVNWSNSFSGTNNIALAAGNYTATVTDIQGCNVINTYAVVDPTMMTLTDSIWTTPSGGNAQIIVSGGTAPYTYSWSNGSPAAYLENAPAGTYTVIVSDAHNCKRSLTVSFDIQLIIPNTITPNADGKNDDFFISNIQAYNNISIEIFTRWGEQVFQYRGTGSNYLNEENRWDGIYKGKELPMGSYLYIITLDESIEAITGAVLIVR